MTHPPPNPYLPPPSGLQPPAAPPPGAAPAWTPPALVRGPDGVAVIVASPENRRRLMVVGPVVLVLAAVLGLGRFDTVGGIITVATIVIALGFAVWVAWRARTVVTYSTVQRSAFGSGGRIHQLADVGEVVLFQRAQSGQAVAPPFLVVRDRAGRRMLAMSSPLWSPADLLALAYALTPQPAVYAAPMRPLDVEARHPGAMRFHEKHPWWTAWIVVGAVVVGATLLVVASFVI